MNNRWKNFLNSFHRIFFLEIQMSIVLMLVVWTGVDLLEMMLLYFNKHIQNMEYSPLQILSSTSLSVIYSRCLVGGGLKACGGPTSKWLEVISLEFVVTYIIFQLLGDFRLVRCLHCNKLVRRGKVGCTSREASNSGMAAHMRSKHAGQAVEVVFLLRNWIDVNFLF